MAKQIKMRKSRAENPKKDDPEVPAVSGFNLITF